MSQSATVSNAPDVDRDASAAHTVASEGGSRAAARYQTVLHQLAKAPKFTAEWFRWKEEEIHLRSHSGSIGSICPGLVADSSNVADDAKLDDPHVSVATAQNILTSKSDVHATGKSYDRTLEGQLPCDSRNNQQTSSVGSEDWTDDHLPGVANNQLPCDSRNNQQTSRVGSEDWTDDHLPGVANNLTAPSRTAPAVTESESPNANERNGRLEIMGQSIGFEAETILSDSTNHDEPPPVPFNSHIPSFKDGHKAEKIAGIVTLPNIHDEVPPSPITIRFADAATEKKMSRVDATTGAKSEHASSVVPQPPTQSNYENNDESQLHQDVAQQAIAMRLEVNINHGLHLLPPVSQRDSHFPRADTNVPSRSVSNENVNNERGNENVIEIPEAFLVEENAPLEIRGVEVAELVEPDRSSFPLKKRHACILSILVAALVIALGLSLYFTRETSSSDVTVQTTQKLSPSLRPSYNLPSQQPSFPRPSSQPSFGLWSEIERNVLQRNVTFNGMDRTNARVLALKWIDEEDSMKLAVSDAKLIQRYVLALLAFEFSKQDMLDDGDECSWVGVDCDEDGHVTTVSLSGYSLSGTLLPEIGTLKNLRRLLLSDNVLYGTLPYEIENLKDLSELDLGSNNFRGSLPSEIGNMKELTKLTLDGNEFTGTLPWELGNLNKLKILSLGYNNFRGPLPSELGNLQKLIKLDLTENWFEGTLPSELGSLKMLNVLIVQMNDFRGTVPSELCNLNKLTQLDLLDSNFSGTLPSEIGNLSMLTFLDLTKNRFSGTLPSEVGNLNKLTQLYFGDNQLTGTLPTQIGNLNEITYMSTYMNLFHGSLPTEIGNLKKAVLVNVNQNQLSGTLPSELGQLSMLEFLYLNNNKFFGTISSELWQLTSLRDFDIKYNRFEGTLPSWIRDFDRLSTLHVGNNKFTGTLPSELGRLTGMHLLGLDSNEFTGTLPSWIGDLKNMTLLWLQHNQFSGTFPPEIENNLDLVDFCLRNNNFTGSLPTERQTYWHCT